MNSKMTKTSQLSTTESKKQKQTKQTRRNRNRIIDMEIIWRVISWGEKGGNVGKGTETKKHNW